MHSHCVRVLCPAIALLAVVLLSIRQAPGAPSLAEEDASNTAAATTPAPKLVNVSTRSTTILLGGTPADNKQIGGFVTTTTGDTFVRTVGPSYQGIVHVYAGDTHIQVFRREG